MVVLGGGQFLMSEVPLYPVSGEGVYTRGQGDVSSGSAGIVSIVYPTGVCPWSRSVVD